MTNNSSPISWEEESSNMDTEEGGLNGSDQTNSMDIPTVSPTNQGKEPQRMTTLQASSALQRVAQAVNKRDQEIDGGKTIGKAGFEIQMYNLSPTKQLNAVNDSSLDTTIRPEVDQIPAEYNMNDFLPEKDRDQGEENGLKGKMDKSKSMRFVLIQREKDNNAAGKLPRKT